MFDSYSEWFLCLLSLNNILCCKRRHPEILLTGAILSDFFIARKRFDWLLRPDETETETEIKNTNLEQK